MQASLGRCGEVALAEAAAVRAATYAHTESLQDLRALHSLTQGTFPPQKRASFRSSTRSALKPFSQSGMEHMSREPGSTDLRVSGRFCQFLCIFSTSRLLEDVLTGIQLTELVVGDLARRTPCALTELSRSPGQGLPKSCGVSQFILQAYKHC